MAADLVVRNSRLVSPSGILDAGVAVKDGVVVAVARDLHLPKADKVIDAKGNYVLPGLLDGHAHTFLPPETAETRTKAAAKGGVTTMLEMPGTQMGCFDIEQYREKKAIMEKAAYVDFCIHAGCDADMVIVDMKRRVKLSNDTQITACGWTPYDGMTVQGWPTTSILRGNVVMEDDQVLSKKGSGRFIPRLDA